MISNFFKKRILVVEDEQSILNVLCDKLSKEGFDLLKAMDGKEGLNKALQEKPDLILLDLLMPVMDGIAMLKELRKDEWGKDAKVVILTNLSGEEKNVLDLDEGKHEFLIKSDWKISDVVKKVKEKLEIK